MLAEERAQPSQRVSQALFFIEYRDCNAEAHGCGAGLIAAAAQIETNIRRRLESSAGLDGGRGSENYGIVRGLRRFWGLAAVFLAVGTVFALLPLGTALQFGGDEGYQLNTGFLMSKGYLLYKQIWYDQPPLLVLLLDWAFRISGPSILAARLISAGFGVAFFGAFFQLVKENNGSWPGMLAVFFLVASPGILELSVSVMQEVPTFALAVASVLLLWRWRRGSHWGWALGSGVAMGLALATKLTACVVVPAVIVEMWLRSRSKYMSAWIKKFAASAAVWGVGAWVTLTLISLVWGRGSFQSSYRAHFAEHPVGGLPTPADFPMPASVFFDHAECVLAAVVGILLTLKWRRAREFAFPFAWLATALGIHCLHRPWWMYYYLHLAIPMAWLAGFAVSEIAKPFCGLFSSSALALSSSRTWKALALCSLAALAIVRSERRAEAAMKDLRARPRANDDPLLAKVRACAGRTRWAYVRRTKEAYAFHAGLLVPPELAVVTLKRFWSDQINEEEIVEICRRYKPEQVLVSRAEITGRWRDFLASYSVVYEGESDVLYVLNSVSDDRVRRVGVTRHGDGAW
jgi:4-amino-4-deoxy-L-arabinose transferase-like glycosyltransferase